MTDTTAPRPDESNEPLFKGERLRAAREAAGLTIEELATAAGATSHEEASQCPASTARYGWQPR